MYANVCINIYKWLECPGSCIKTRNGRKEDGQNFCQCGEKERRDGGGTATGGF